MVAGTLNQNAPHPEFQKATEKSDFTVSNVKQALPKEVFTRNNGEATKRLVLTLGFFAGSMALTAYSPAVLMPVCWLISSLAYYSLFVLAHDCGHNSFFNAPVLNTIAGTICMIPIFYPLEAWRLHHNLHHKEEKTATHRILQAQKSKSFLRLINILWWPYDVLALVLLYYDLSIFNEKKRNGAFASVFFSYATIAVFIPLCIYQVGLQFINFWLMPWLLFHFWKNTIRQALPSINYSYASSFDQNKKYQTYDNNVNQGSKPEVITGLVHYKFPAWFEFVCHNVNYQVPHYLSTDIPCYNLPKAYNYLLQSKWKSAISEQTFGWSFFKKNIIYRISQESNPVDSKPSADPNFRKLPGPLWKRLNYLHITLFSFTHISALYALFFVPLEWKTFAWAVVWYYCTGLGITGGYHRLWAHRAYSANWIVRFFLMLFGSGAVEGSIKWWSRDHRAHHRYTDTDKDPYNAKRGFWYSHMGWMLVKEDHTKIGHANIDDLMADPMIRIQHKLYGPIALFMSFVFPCLVAGYGWGDYLGGYYWAGIIRLCFVHHATFFVNSLAHYFGDDTFADTNTPRDSFITAVLTLGEGYHNFHHEFPKDYRNAIKFWQYDPTKWVIRLLAFFGAVWNLHVFPENEVKKGQLQMQQKKIDQMRNYIDWGPEIANLPEFTMDQVKERKQKTGEEWMVIGNIIHDVAKWKNDHPGGSSFIQSYIGKDATSAFTGDVYKHSNAGRNVLTALRVGRIALETSHHHNELDEDKYEVQFTQDTPSLHKRKGE